MIIQEPKWVVKEAKPQSDHTIQIRFADGKSGVFDASGLLKDPYYKKLKDISFFMMGHVAYDTVVWNEDLDIAPEMLYDSCISAV